MKFLLSTLMLTFSLLLFSCKKDNVQPVNPPVPITLTTQEKQELDVLIKANPGVPVDVLIGLMGLCDNANTAGITNNNDL